MKTKESKEQLTLMHNFMDVDESLCGCADINYDYEKYLEDNYSRPDLKIENLCERIHLSHSYISRIFREFEGCSIMNYLEDVRMERACFLLITTDFSVSRVGYSVGYNDILHFMKQFKRKYGMTCVEYRQEKKILK